MRPRVHACCNLIDFKWYGIPFPPDKAEPPAVDGLDSNGYNVPNTRVGIAHQEYSTAGVVLSSAPAAIRMSSPSKVFLDEVASASGSDPYHMRASFWRASRTGLKVLDTAAEKATGASRCPKAAGAASHFAILRTASARRSPK